MKKYILIAFLLLICFGTYGQVITTIAGTGTAGYNGDGIAAVTAEINGDISVALDGAGNLYIADEMNNRVRKVSTTGIITTVAGTGVAGYSGDGGAATDAQLNSPRGVAVDRTGNIYIAEGLNNCIRKINTAGIISTCAGSGVPGRGGYSGDGGQATDARLLVPFSVTTDSVGNLFICEVANSVIRKVNTSGVITTVAGTGTASSSFDGGMATATTLNNPIGVVIDNFENIYITDNNSNRVRKVDFAGVITTIAGTGTAGSSGDNIAATTAQLQGIGGLVIDNFGNLYISEAGHNRIRMVNAAGIITTIAGGGSTGLGDGGSATAAELNYPSGVALDKNGNIYIADSHNNRVRYTMSTVSIDPIVNTALVDVRIFPNPSHGSFAVNINSVLNTPVHVIITNATGEKIKELMLPVNQQVNINLAVPAGIYFLNGITDHQKWCKKMVVIN